jgi:hypothetical protein
MSKDQPLFYGIKARPDGNIPARYLGDSGHYDICLRVYVRASMGKDIPSQRMVENKISDLLLAMPRLDEGAEWDVSATSLPEPQEDRCPHSQFHTGAGACPACEGRSLKEPER